ncbi:hypothetical protein [Ruania halotolerans]|uniref:hypothetical protein n=1 Tax=Ruania halotolerans TaxID=2897773 RepID=UPI001E5CDA17|nr:hypothetical protein [Ruania halotolerans]UFU07091.1 hypothetical protein LQF10_02970 [Ruania halotolerans]
MGQSSESVEEWARTAHFPFPIRWGAVEDAILDRRPPPLEDEQGQVGRAILKAIVLLVAIAVYGAGAIGLAAIALGSSAASGIGSDSWLSLARIAFLVSLVALMTVLAVWWSDGRRRGPWDVLAAGCTALTGSGATLILLVGRGEVGGLGALTIVAALGGLVAVIVLLAASRSRTVGRRRWSIDPMKDRRYLAARQRVLAVLEERGLTQELSEGSRQQLKNMPLGTWHQLDRAPGE